MGTTTYERITVTKDDGSTYEVAVPKDFRRRFRKVCRDMRKLLDEFREHAPEGSLYLQEDTPHLMAGLSHIGNDKRATPSNVYEDGDIWPYSGGGGW